MGVPEELLEFLDLCLEVDRDKRATIGRLAKLEVCQPGYDGAPKWPPITRRLQAEVIY
jgi:hypothetical protein